MDEALTILIEAENKAREAPWFSRTLDIYKHIMTIHLNKNDLEAAEDVCMRTLEKQPNFPDAHYWLGKIKIAQAK